MQCPALQGNARHRKSKQRGSELGNRLFSGPLWPDGNAWQGNAMQSTELRFKATRIGAWQQAPFRAALARAHSGAWKRTDLHGSARHISALQSNADRPLATAGFPGRFGPKAPPWIAPQAIAKQGSSAQFKATRIGAWQQALFRAALVRRQSVATQGKSLTRRVAHFKATRIGAWRQASFRAALVRTQRMEPP